LWIGLGLNAAFLVAEVLGGLAFDSLALLADAAHQTSDVVALGISLVAVALVTRPGSARHTYGLRRAEALGAQANAVLLLVAAAAVFVEAVPRLADPEPIDGLGVVALAMVGLVVNAGSALLVARAGANDLNLRGAFVHLVSDALGSVAVIGAGIAMLAFDAEWVDPAASILIGLLVVVAAWRLLRDTTNVLLEGTPRGLDLGEVEAALAMEPAVAAVHHLHVWELGSDLPALSVHVVLESEPTLHDAQERADGIKTMLAARFGIEHATIELECHDCEAAATARHDRPDRPTDPR
jgi:cobalt-zinc-cadmium efflux system protein